MSTTEENTIPDWRKPLSEAARRRIQVCFEKGSKMVAQGQHEYAADMFGQCVGADPGNRLYVQHLLHSLYQKYNNNKKGSNFAGFKGASHKSAAKKASSAKDWVGVIKAGVESLKLNPWDTAALVSMAKACQEMEFDECELAYLKGALDADAKNLDINKICAEALARQGQYEQAIACWHRIEKARPTDEGPKKIIAELSVKKTIVDGRLGKADESDEGAVRRMKRQEASQPTEDNSAASPVERLRKAIAGNPAEVRNYLELADLLTTGGDLKESAEVLKKAMQVSGGAIEARERLEDVQLRQWRERVDVGVERFRREGTPENEKTVRKLKAELNNVELEVYRNRVERHPSNLSMKFELGVRLRRAGNVDEAIKAFQAARQDPRHPGEVAFNLGECFMQIKQYPLARKHFQEAAEEMPAKAADLKKEALYWAGKVSAHLKDYEAAQKHLTDLAALDFGYKDVAALLDKISKIGKND